MAEMTCIVVTPEQTALESPCRFVALPLFDGEKGIGANHAPMIGRLGCGELRLHDIEGKVHRYYVDGGFVQIAENVVSIMTNRAVVASKLDAAEIQERLMDAESRKANSEELFEIREKAVTQARAQLRVARRNSGSSPGISGGH